MSDQPLNFFTLGDWGKASINQAAVSHAMSAAAVVAPSIPDFVLALGDNFYQWGVSDADDKQFNTTFEARFKDPNIRPEWYVILGNHDYRQTASPAAQREYSATHPDSKFILPDLQYIKYMDLCSNKNVNRDEYTGTCPDGLAAFVFIDTPHLAPEDTCCLVKETLTSLYGGWAGVEVATAEAYDWIETTLESIDNDDAIKWLFVNGHYPIYTVAEHGNYADSPPPAVVTLRDKLLPMLESYRVDAYFSGHDHVLEHIVSRTAPSLNFIVSGSGSKLGTIDHGTPPNTKVEYAEILSGFTRHVVSNDRMLVEYIGYRDGDIGKESYEGSGEVLHNFTQCPNRGDLAAPHCPPLGPALAKEKGGSGGDWEVAVGLAALGVVAAGVLTAVAIKKYGGRRKKSVCCGKREDEYGLKDEL